MRLMLPALALLTLPSAWAVAFSPFWLFALIPFALLLLLGIYDVLQSRRSILRDFPVLGHARFLAEFRPVKAA